MRLHEALMKNDLHLSYQNHRCHYPMSCRYHRHYHRCYNVIVELCWNILVIFGPNHMDRPKRYLLDST